MSNKQGIYGFFFLLIAVLIVYGIYAAFFRSEGSCTDGILNQTEEKVDCGGSCTKCEITELQSFRVTREPVALSAGRNTAIIFEIMNPNRDYDAPRVPYTLRIYESGGRVIEEINGEASAPALRRKTVLESGVRTYVKSIARVELTLGDPEWEKSFSALSPALSLSSPSETKVISNTIRVTGSVKNESSFAANEVEIIAVLADEYGRELFASKTAISGIPAAQEREFSVAFPSDESLSRLLSATRTRVIIQAN